SATSNGAVKWKQPVCPVRGNCRSMQCSTATKPFSKISVNAMADESPHPSAIIFPVALQPAVFEPVVEILQRGDTWGWLELFVLSQVFWGVLLFIPGSQAFR